MWHNSSHTVDVVKPGGGMNTWKRPLLPSRQLSRPGRLLKALGRASYDAAKQNARHAVHHARQEADKKVYENIDPKFSEVYRLANQSLSSWTLFIRIIIFQNDISFLTFA